MARLGIRGFNPKLKKAAESLAELRRPEGEPIPPCTLAELYRDMQRRRLILDQIGQLEGARLERIKQARKAGTSAMSCSSPRDRLGIETADTLVQEVMSHNLRDQRALGRSGGLTGSPTKAETNAEKKDSPDPACSRAPRNGSARLALPQFPEGERPGAMVQCAHQERRGSRKKMIVALARKHLIALWHLARDGGGAQGVTLRPAMNARRFSALSPGGRRMTVRGDGVPVRTLASSRFIEWVRRPLPEKHSTPARPSWPVSAPRHGAPKPRAPPSRM